MALSVKFRQFYLKLKFMNKVKVYLGISCLLLAIGTVVVTKASTSIVIPEYYINDSGVCALAPQPTNCSATGSKACLIAVAGQIGVKQVYDDRVNGVCNTPLRCQCP